MKHHDLLQMFVSLAALTEDVKTYAYLYNTTFLHCLPLATHLRTQQRLCQDCAHAQRPRTIQIVLSFLFLNKHNF